MMCENQEKQIIYCRLKKWNDLCNLYKKEFQNTQEPLAFLIDNVVYYPGSVIPSEGHALPINDRALFEENIQHTGVILFYLSVYNLLPNIQMVGYTYNEDCFICDFICDQNLSNADHELDILCSMSNIFSSKQGVPYSFSPIKNFDIKLVPSFLQKHNVIMSFFSSQGKNIFFLPESFCSFGKKEIFVHFSPFSGYKRNDNVLIQRVVGKLFFSYKEKETHINYLNKIAESDHRKLGSSMDLFHLQDDSPGSIFWHPRGYSIWVQIEKYIRDVLSTDYQEIKTPQLISCSLWKKSGHWDKFKGNMFIMDNKSVQDNAEGKDSDNLIGIKPMNCPCHIQVFNKFSLSYRDLPVRYSEFGCCHRNEYRGSMHGLMRVRQMTQDDAHIFCTFEQIASEIESFCLLVDRVYKHFGFNNYSIRLGTRPSTRVGSDEIWDKMEGIIQKVLKEIGIDFQVDIEQGAFYGPKVEFHFIDNFKRSWQCGTIQVDMVLPERLNAFYTNAKGIREHPIMLHRAILGTFERFIGILLEHYSGWLPFWLAPHQVAIFSLSKKYTEYSLHIYQTLQKGGIRAYCNVGDEKIGKKIRECFQYKIPYSICIGEKELTDSTLNVKDTQNSINSASVAESELLSFFCSKL